MGSGEEVSSHAESVGECPKVGGRETVLGTRELEYWIPTEKGGWGICENCLGS